jgi:hypothetical protein
MPEAEPRRNSLLAPPDPAGREARFGWPPSNSIRQVRSCYARNSGPRTSRRIRRRARLVAAMAVPAFRHQSSGQRGHPRSAHLIVARARFGLVIGSVGSDGAATSLAHACPIAHEHACGGGRPDDERVSARRLLALTATERGRRSAADLARDRAA